jgi:hypothetical protein
LLTRTLAASVDIVVCTQRLASNQNAKAGQAFVTLNAGRSFRLTSIE